MRVFSHETLIKEQWYKPPTNEPLPAFPSPHPKEPPPPKMEHKPEIHLVTTTSSPEFTSLTQTLPLTTILALDAEWKPIHHHHPSLSPSFPTVTLLQLACRLPSYDVVFLLDLTSLPFPSIYSTLKEFFSSPDVLKLGFRFKQDLAYLSHTFSSCGSLPGFDKVEPYMDITSIYHSLRHKHVAGKVPKETKSLANICKEVLGISLSKELQCSDWSHRPLTDEQINYAAMDAHCLLRIFSVFQAKVADEGKSSTKVMEQLSSETTLGLKEILEQHDADRFKFRIFEALDIMRATISTEYFAIMGESGSMSSRTVSRITMPMEESLLKIVRKYGEKILLRQSDRKPKSSKKKGKKKAPLIAVGKRKHFDNVGDWQGPASWDLSIGGDGCPKFLCDVMVEGLAKHLRCVGIDAASPYSKKPEPRELIDQAYKEQRVLLTRDAKLLRHQYLIQNQIYRVKSLLKNEQLLEVIETFELTISEDQLMSRCTKCNGRFIQKPLTTEEAVEAAKGFQRIPSCLFDKNLEFWQCMECNQLYWEGTQYHNAVQKFIDICKLNE